MYTIAFENRLEEITAEAAEMVKTDIPQARDFVKGELAKMFYDGDVSKIKWHNYEWMNIVKKVPLLKHPNLKMDEYITMINDRSQKYGISPELAELASYAFWDDSGPLGQYISEKLGPSFSLKDCLEYVAKLSGEESEEIEVMQSLYALAEQEVDPDE